MNFYLPEKKQFLSKSEYDIFIKQHNNLHVLDLYKQLAFEKFLTENAEIYFSAEDIQKRQFEKYCNNVNKSNEQLTLGEWVFHPWNKRLIHVLSQDDYVSLRTIRHRNLLSRQEQNILYHKTIALAGLSVGSNVVEALIRYGIGNDYFLADSDTVSCSNFNRTLYTLDDIQNDKIDVVIKRINAIDPYIKVHAYTEGLNINNLENFISKADVVIDAFDNFTIKLALRKLAKSKKVPVVSGFDVEKGTLLIVERYDIEENLDTEFYLNNYDIGQINKGTLDERTQMFINIIGKKYHSKRMLESVQKVGTTLTGYPQLIIATFLTSSLFTLAVESILLKRNFPSTRKFYDLF